GHGRSQAGSGNGPRGAAAGRRDRGGVRPLRPRASRTFPTGRVPIGVAAARTAAGVARGALPGAGLPLVAARHLGHAALGAARARAHGVGRNRPRGALVAVGYFSKASRRALPATVAGARAPGVGSLKPATPTRSPLAEVDQRLHLDMLVTPP